MLEIISRGSFAKLEETSRAVLWCFISIVPRSLFRNFVENYDLIKCIIKTIQLENDLVEDCLTLLKLIYQQASIEDWKELCLDILSFEGAFELEDHFEDLDNHELFEEYQNLKNEVLIPS